MAETQDIINNKEILKSTEVEIPLGPIATMVVTSNDPYYTGTTTSHRNFSFFITYLYVTTNRGNKGTIVTKGHSQIHLCFTQGF